MATRPWALSAGGLLQRERNAEWWVSSYSVSDFIKTKTKNLSVVIFLHFSFELEKTQVVMKHKYNCICLIFNFFVWFCFKVLWPIQETNSASESIRCQMSAGGVKCRNPAIWACQNKRHFDGLCRRCFTRAQVGSFVKIRKDEIYCRVCYFFGVIFLVFKIFFLYFTLCSILKRNCMCIRDF